MAEAAEPPAELSGRSGEACAPVVSFRTRGRSWCNVVGLMSAEPRALVLVVEDDVGSQLITAMALHHFGYDVVKADSLDGARRIARELRALAVVLDCRLPDGDGLELTRTWRREPGMERVQVLVLTAFALARPRTSQRLRAECC